jgi:hypothetical protein
VIPSATCPARPCKAGTKGNANITQIVPRGEKAWRYIYRRLVREVILTFARDAVRERAKVAATSTRQRGQEPPQAEN